MNIELIYKNYWENLEKEIKRPSRLRDLKFLDYNELVSKIDEKNVSFAKAITESLYMGDVYIFKNAFSKDFMLSLREKTHQFCKNRSSEFYKMLEGSPDFHRIIDLETGKNYSFRSCKHSCYFYTWNNDPLEIFEEIYDKWRLIKVLMGLNKYKFEKNTPISGVVDRVQVVRYPPKIGYLEPHSDPYLNQRLFFSGYMSKKDVDFKGGGFYLVDKDDQVVDVEDKINIGDIGVGYATVYHGVAPCDKDKEPDWSNDDGRWFLSMYSNSSDEVPNRHTGKPIKLNINGDLPDEVH